ncbi:divergent PAP2 family protein [Thermotoga sp.]|uniref:divergent PAP2 family protein n=1 Tax=Thermotoga sp. TaxID=28240 RepID=UPI0025F6209C|nr:divergent PAP2 family protein [Thermotoga sp.]MCD6551474.1 divergent PAP2 family protein [Thermotoga sp.]
MLDIWKIFRSTPFTTAVVSFLVAQFIKFLIKRDVKMLKSYGGMPSGHVATVSGLAWSLARSTGFDSPYTSIASIFLVIIFMDAIVLRPAVKKDLGHSFLEALAGLGLGMFIAHLFPARLHLW